MSLWSINLSCESYLPVVGRDRSKCLCGPSIRYVSPTYLSCDEIVVDVSVVNQLVM